MPDRQEIFAEIDEERGRQDRKFGEQRHLPDYTWATILGEEYGEVCRAMLEKDFPNLREELIQVAAVCVAAIEDLDRSRRVQ